MSRYPLSGVRRNFNPAPVCACTARRISDRVEFSATIVSCPRLNRTSGATAGICSSVGGGGGGAGGGSGAGCTAFAGCLCPGCCWAAAAIFQSTSRSNITVRAHRSLARRAILRNATVPALRPYWLDAGRSAGAIVASQSDVHPCFGSLAQARKRCNYACISNDIATFGFPRPSVLIFTICSRYPRYYRCPAPIEGGTCSKSIGSREFCGHDLSFSSRCPLRWLQSWGSAPASLRRNRAQSSRPRLLSRLAEARWQSPESNGCRSELCARRG